LDSPLKGNVDGDTTDVDQAVELVVLAANGCALAAAVAQADNAQRRAVSTNGDVSSRENDAEEAKQSAHLVAAGALDGVAALDGAGVAVSSIGATVTTIASVSASRGSRGSRWHATSGAGGGRSRGLSGSGLASSGRSSRSWGIAASVITSSGGGGGDTRSGGRNTWGGGGGTATRVASSRNGGRRNRWGGSGLPGNAGWDRGGARATLGHGDSHGDGSTRSTISGVTKERSRSRSDESGERESSDQERRVHCRLRLVKEGQEVFCVLNERLESIETRKERAG
jgi:hypothetical protein